LQAIGDYLREHHPSLAASTIRRLYDSARSLKKFPHRGRVGEAENTRELMALPMPYIIVYRVDPDLVHIFRVLHGAQDIQETR